MRLLHTSDWHLGRGLHGVDLLEAQRAVLHDIVAVAVTAGVDAVLVAGDVYDRAVPPVEAVRLLEEVLLDLDEAGLTTILISGNHDSATRLGFGGALFGPRLHVRTTLARIDAPVLIADEHGPVAVYSLPFLDPDVARHALADGDDPLARHHEAVMAAAMRRVRADLAGRVAADPATRAVVVAHAFVVGGHVSDSERDLQVGGVATVPSAVFDGVDYVALGHLHRPQQPSSVGTDAVLRYAGSPLRYSFSEADHEKSVTLVDLGPRGRLAVSEVPLRQPRGMAVLSGPLADLLSPEHDHLADHWVSVTVTDPRRPEDMFELVRSRFPQVLRCVHLPDTVARDDVPGVVDTATIDPVGVVGDFLEHVTGGPVLDDELAEVAAAYDAVLAGGREA